MSSKIPADLERAITTVALMEIDNNIGRVMAKKFVRYQLTSRLISLDLLQDAYDNLDDQVTEILRNRKQN